MNSAALMDPPLGLNRRIYSYRHGNVVSKPAEVLVVEDDPQDAFFLRRAFSKAGLRATVWVAVDGGEARARLAPPTPTPDLVILDLSLPGEGGLRAVWLP